MRIQVVTLEPDTHAAGRMGADRRHRIVRRVFGAALVRAVLAAPPGAPLAASARPRPAVPTAALGQVYDVAIANGDWPAYVSTSTGLYRAVSHAYTLWQKQSALAIRGMSPNPRHPNDLLLVRQTSSNQNEPSTFIVERSSDGGRTAQPTSMQCGLNELERAPSAPRIVYGLLDCPRTSGTI